MLSALLALTLCVGLAACGGGTDNPPVTPSSGASIAAPTEEPTEEPVLELPPRPAVTEEDTEYLIFKKIEGKDEYSVSFDPEKRWCCVLYVDHSDGTRRASRDRNRGRGLFRDKYPVSLFA